MMPVDKFFIFCLAFKIATSLRRVSDKVSHTIESKQICSQSQAERILDRVFPNAEAHDVYDTLQRLELTLKDQKCVFSLLPEPILPQRAGGHDLVGPASFVDRQWEARATTPQLPQLLDLGISLDREKLWALHNTCVAAKKEVLEKFSERHYGNNAQNWLFCTFYGTSTKNKITADHVMLLRHLHPLFETLQKSKLMVYASFSKLYPNMLVEWHAGYVAHLVVGTCTKCGISADTRFRPSKQKDIVRVYIPFSDQSETHFFISGSRIHMPPAQMLLFDFFQPHSLYNSGADSRVNLLLNLNLQSLRYKTNVQQLVQDEFGRSILTGILNMGWHDPLFNRARSDLQRVLYEYQHNQETCKSPSQEYVSFADTFERLNRERGYANLDRKEPSHEILRANSQACKENEISVIKRNRSLTQGEPYNGPTRCSAVWAKEFAK
eukprot:gnl/MRDRNA2_/MRDRNA2_86544_c0_seq1.p1 gnl/MRDRNA2_/MRDRNA2_86544_c0~~gnl/MRDRNA2_/MRDRNA2_86544_c0_seq1.p1  ORF type:complete len:437 (-),score=55.35 gnl/MRDRNA2_/MRDRNA2_86544_c0_seq1:224-1534(-)